MNQPYREQGKISESDLMQARIGLIEEITSSLARITYAVSNGKVSPEQGKYLLEELRKFYSAVIIDNRARE